MFANAPAIALTNLNDGLHTVEVIGRNSAGFWQETNSAAVKTWTVQTNPALEITEVSRNGNVVSLIFTAEAGKTYTVQYRDALDDAHPWVKLLNVPAQAITGSFEAKDLNANVSATRFYRLVTPAQP